MEDYEVYVQGSVATFADGKVGIDSESRLLFCDNPRHMEFLVPMTPKVEIISKVKALMKQAQGKTSEQRVPTSQRPTYY